MASLVEKNRARVLQAVVRGATRIPDVAEATGLSAATVNKRLVELEAEGRIRLHRQRGRTGSRIEQVGGGSETVAATSLDPVVTQPQTGAGHLSTTLPVAAIWIKAPLAAQEIAKSKLEASGATAIFDCTGGFDLFAIYPPDMAQEALNIARGLSKRGGYTGVDYSLIVGRSKVSASS